MALQGINTVADLAQADLANMQFDVGGQLTGIKKLEQRRLSRLLDTEVVDGSRANPLANAAVATFEAEEPQAQYGKTAGFVQDDADALHSLHVAATAVPAADPRAGAGLQQTAPQQEQRQRQQQIQMSQQQQAEQ